MTSYLTWPRGLLTPRSERWGITGQVSTGGQSLGGISQTTNSSGGGYWTCDFDGIWMRTAPQVKAWRALEALLDGGVTGIIVPSCDCKFSPLDSASYVPHSDGTLFDDGTGYLSGAGSAEFVGAYALRATRVQVQVINGVLTGGEIFTVDHATVGPRRYVVGQVHGVVGDVYDVTIRTPLRAAVVDGEAVDFANPRVVMKLATSDEMALTVDMGRQAMGAVRFVEAFGIGALEE